MKIESEKVKLNAFEVSQLGSLSAEQLEILNLFKMSCSIAEVVQFFYGKRKLVSFVAMRQLIDILIEKRVIANPSYYSHFSVNKNFTLPKTPQIELKPLTGKVDRYQVSKVPFLRSLSGEMLDVFLHNSSLLNVPAGVVFCHEGMQQRSLLVLLKGEASVYKKNKNGQQDKLVVLTENSLFGEAAFFFGTPRSASVIADVPCQVLVMKYIPEVYDGMIRIDKAKELQWRIWTVHALLKSAMFKDLPQDSFDALIFAGELKGFASKAVICKQDDPGDACYVVVQGKVSIYKDKKLLKVMEQGDCFGEMALMVSAGKRTATVMADTDGYVLEIKRQQFYKMLAENLLLACEFEKIALLRRAANS